MSSSWKSEIVQSRVDAPTSAEPAGAPVCGILLAGSYHWGEGDFERRLRGPLLPVAQTPIIRYPLEWLRAGGVHEVAICANSATPAVRGYLGDGARLSMELHYFEDHEPRGPAGCVRDAARLSSARTFVVADGALVPSLDLRALLDAHERSGAAATVVVEIDRRRRAVGGDRQRLPGGVYVFDRRVLNTIPERGFHDIKQGLLDRLYADGERVLMHEVQGVTPRVLDYASYLSVSRWLIARAVERPDFHDAHVRVGDALLHPSAHVDPGAELIGPVLVGPRARIAGDAVIVGPTTIGADSAVHAGAVVSRSIVWERCSIGAGAVVDTSLLADGAAVRAGERLYSASRIVDDAVAPRDPAAFATADLVRVPAAAVSLPGSLALAFGPPQPPAAPAPVTAPVAMSVSDARYDEVPA